jgi:hypothetical protein
MIRFDILLQKHHEYDGIRCISAGIQVVVLTQMNRNPEKRKERVCGAVGATSIPSTVGSFSFLTMLFIPTFSQH